jgi:hypothetical protein
VGQGHIELGFTEEGGLVLVDDDHGAGSIDHTRAERAIPAAAKKALPGLKKLRFARL